MTATLRTTAPGKINLCLYLGTTREDGLHDLVSVIEPISLSDELTLEQLPAEAEDQVICPAVPGKNLAAEAIELFRERTGYAGPSLRLTITKHVPIAGGMGGGSADAAATLRLLCALSDTDPEDQAIGEIAWQLGADVPSQLRLMPSLVSGAGENVTYLSPDSLPPHSVVVVPLDHQLATGSVFQIADRLALARPADELQQLHQRLQQLLVSNRHDRFMPELLANDLRPAAHELCPALGELLNIELTTSTKPTYLSITGSGPTVIAIWDGPDHHSKATAFAANLKNRYPQVTVCRPLAEAEATVEAVKI